MHEPITLDTTLGMAAAQRPVLIPLFERHGLDFCCHGGRSIREACAEAGVDARTLLLESERPDAPTRSEHDWTTRSMDELCTHIVATHHTKAREALARLDVLLPKIEAAHGARHPELLELTGVVHGLREEMLDHMVREERVLFPWLRRLETPSAITVGPPWSVQRPIDCMMHDHESVAGAFARARALTDNYRVPEDACASYRSAMDALRDLEHDTHVHIHKENNILFPRGIDAERARGLPARRDPASGTMA